MLSRPKTFGEFYKGITIVHRENGGVKIICKRGEFVILETRYKPWNSRDTKTTFLINLYIKEVLSKVDLSKKIKRPEGFELLGKRCLHNEQLLIICGWEEMANTETGEIVKMLTLAGRWASPVPFKTPITNVQL